MKTILIMLTIILGFAGMSVYLITEIPSLLPLLNYVTITKGNVIYYLHFSPPVM